MIELLVGPDKISVDCKDIKNVSIKYQIKDIKNYGKRNISYSKPITVYKTKESETVFKSLYNINVTNGYDISNYITGELVENGITTFRGVLRIVSSNTTSYDVVLTSSQFNIFDDMGSSLIDGNGDPSLNISFDVAYSPFTYTRDNIRTALKANPLTYGEGYQLAFVDYDNTISSLDDIRYDYPILPNIAAKEVFDAIFTKYGYTYTLSDDIDMYLSHLYIPFNDDINNFYVDTSSHYRLGTSDNLWNGGGTWPSSIPSGMWEIYRNVYYDNTLRGSSSTDDKLLDDSVDNTDVYGYEVPMDGTYEFEYNLKLGKAYQYISPNWYERRPCSTDFNVLVKRDGDVIQTENIGTFDPSWGAWTPTSETDLLNPYVTDTVNYTVTLDLQRGDYVKLQAESDYSEESIESRQNAYYTRIAVIYDSTSYFIVSKQNTLYNVTFTMNDMLPKDYSQADFINDIFKMFNCYLEIDESDPTNLIIKSYNEYYNNNDLIDWTDKIDNESLEAESIKNEFARKTMLTYSEDSDIFNEDYLTKFGYSFGNKTINNDSNIADKENTIKLSSAPTIVTTINHVTI